MSLNSGRLVSKIPVDYSRSCQNISPHSELLGQATNPISCSKMFDIIARDDERCTKQTAKQEKGINYYIRDQNVRLICGRTPETDVVGCVVATIFISRLCILENSKKA